MRMLLTLLFAASLAACAAPRAQSADKPDIPKLLKPHGGKTAAREAGFGPAAPFVP